MFGLDFLLKALMAGTGIAIIAGPLGSLMIWRKMAYFGDTLAHSTLLGASIALLFNINLYIGLISVSLLVALMLVVFSRQNTLATDAILGLLSHTALALGLILATAITGLRVDLLSYLFGDLLSVTSDDLILIVSVAIGVLLVLAKFWRSFLAVTIQEDIAKVEGINVEIIKITFILLLAVVFAIAMKLIGVLLITALLIIPASSARQIAKTPTSMAVIASVLGVLAVFSGMICSLNFDWPVGPAIVTMASVIFLGCYLFSNIFIQEN